MKKILAVLLVLAVAGGVFAQEGEWWIGAQAEIGAYVDLIGVYYDPVDGDIKEDQALVTAAGYHSRDWWTPMTGQLNMGYTRGGLGIDLNFSNLDWKFGGGVKYTGEGYQFQAEADLDKIITGTDSVSRLWGWYDFVNGMVHVDVAYNSYDNGDSFWTSNMTAVMNPIQKPWDGGDSFTKSDHHNYFMTDIRLSGLSFGIYIPGIFTNRDKLHDNGYAYNGDVVYNLHDRLPAGIDQGYYDGGWGSPVVARKLVDDVIKRSIFGVKFVMDPFDVAAQLKLGEDTEGKTAYGVYFGGGWRSGPVDAGISFTGMLASPETGQWIKAGASVGYNPGAFGVGLKGWYGVRGNSKENGDALFTIKGDDGMWATDVGGLTQIGVEPSFFYNVIPTHLQFKTEFGIYFNSIYADAKDSEVIYALRPQLFWNFLGTGAGGPNWWEAASTGMAFRYNMIREGKIYGGENSFEVYFRFKSN